jgi:hypothetical protein
VGYSLEDAYRDVTAMLNGSRHLLNAITLPGSQPLGVDELSRTNVSDDDVGKLRMSIGGFIRQKIDNTP